MTPTSLTSPRSENPAPPVRRIRPGWLVAGGIAVLLAVFAFGIYRYGWDGAVTQIVSRVVPYPAALVEGRVIRYADFQEDLDVLRRFYEGQRASALPGSRFPEEAELRTRVLERLIKDELAAALAGRYGIAVTSDDVRSAYESTILDQTSLGTAGGKARAEARAESTLRDLYGLDSGTFKTRILHPFLVRQQLEAAIMADDALNAEKIRKAEEAAAALKAGAAFKEVAGKYSEDPSAAATGGERGWLGKGLMPREVEETAKALKVGEVSGVVRSPLGFHVIRLAGREGEGDGLRLKVQEILVRPIRLDDYLEAQRKTASVIVFVH